MKATGLLLIELALAGCGQTSPTNNVTPVNAPIVQTSSNESAQVAEAPASPAANAAEDAPHDAAKHAFGSPAAKSHPGQANAMLAAAEKTWEATNASYDVGTTTLANVHHWSRQLLLAERALAETNEQDLAALVEYWKRTKQTYLKIRALYNTGTRGGETENFGAASFYLAEAELWLLDAGGTIPDSTD
jgi:hypothetical protein